MEEISEASHASNHRNRAVCGEGAMAADYCGNGREIGGSASNLVLQRMAEGFRLKTYNLSTALDSNLGPEQMSSNFGDCPYCLASIPFQLRACKRSGSSGRGGLFTVATLAKDPSESKHFHAMAKDPWKSKRLHALAKNPGESKRCNVTKGRLSHVFPSFKDYPLGAIRILGMASCFSWKSKTSQGSETRQSGHSWC
mmetsp:Transcript_87853/g.155771  ORF Transcript_87853/g.155771 Transcript_87853/m.155771 type:complete len:197 (+) Transcript_87853:199-789(+)